MGMTAYTFWNLREISEIFWMIPLMGFAQLSLFGGYAIYFAELFPTRLRSTGTSFCYNVGRFAAAAGPFTLGYLTKDVFGRQAGADALRRRRHVPGLPGRPGRAAVRAGDQRQAAAGVTPAFAAGVPRVAGESAARQTPLLHWQQAEWRPMHSQG